jgi:hypothetical protein
MSSPDRRTPRRQIEPHEGVAKLVDRNHRAMSIRRQCESLGIAHSGLYRPRRAANDNDLPLRRRIDELFTSWPFLGSRQLTAPLRTEGHSDHGLGQPGGAGVAAVQHHGRVVLRLGAGGGAGALWPAGILQHRPGRPVHRHCLHRRADGGRSAYLDGRPRRVSDHLPPAKSSGVLGSPRGLPGPIGAKGLCFAARRRENSASRAD